MPHLWRPIGRLVFVLATTLGVSFCLTSSAGAVLLGSQPSVDVRPGTGIEDVVARGVDNHVYYTSFDGSQWTGWTDLGGPTYSDARPAVISYGTNHVDVYVRDSARRLMHRWWDGSSWRPWEPVGGAWQLAGDPALVSWSPGRLDAFARGDDGSLIHAYFAGAGWSSWESLGGVITTDPTPISLYAGHLDIFALGTGGLMYHKYFAGGWSGWYQLGRWQYTSRVAAVPWTTGSPQAINVFARGMDGAVDQNWWINNGTDWATDYSTGGYFAGAPAVSAIGYSQADVFVRGGYDGTLYNKSCCYPGWTGWVQHGTLRMGSDPAALAYAGHMDVFALDSGGSLIHQAYYDGGWHDWEWLGHPNDAGDPGSIDQEDGISMQFPPNDADAIGDGGADAAGSNTAQQRLSSTGTMVTTTTTTVDQATQSRSTSQTSKAGSASTADPCTFSDPRHKKLTIYEPVRAVSASGQTLFMSAKQDNADHYTDPNTNAQISYKRFFACATGGARVNDDRKMTLYAQKLIYRSSTPALFTKAWGTGTDGTTITVNFGLAAGPLTAGVSVPVHVGGTRSGTVGTFNTASDWAPFTTNQVSGWWKNDGGSGDYQGQSTMAIWSVRQSAANGKIEGRQQVKASRPCRLSYCFPTIIA